MNQKESPSHAQRLQRGHEDLRNGGAVSVDPSRAIGLHDADWQPRSAAALRRHGYGRHGSARLENLPPAKAAELYKHRPRRRRGGVPLVESCETTRKGRAAGLSRRLVSPRVASPRVVSRRFASPRVVSLRFASFRIVSFRVASLRCSPPSSHPPLPRVFHVKHSCAFCWMFHVKHPSPPCEHGCAAHWQRTARSAPPARRPPAAMHRNRRTRPRPRCPHFATPLAAAAAHLAAPQPSCPGARLRCVLGTRLPPPAAAADDRPSKRPFPKRRLPVTMAP